MNTPPGRAILVLIGDRLPEEVKSHERRFAALPHKRHFRYTLRPYVLPRIRFQQGLRHTEVAVGIQPLLREEVAVFAVEVANRAA